MRFAILLFSVCCVVVVKGQFFDGIDSFRSFGGGLDSPLQATRDPRQNPGPVVFPPAPPDNGETSGVVVGASGYGFVPPGQSYTITNIIAVIIGFLINYHLQRFAAGWRWRPLSERVKELMEVPENSSYPKSQGFSSQYFTFF